MSAVERLQLLCLLRKTKQPIAGSLFSISIHPFFYLLFFLSLFSFIISQSIHLIEFTSFVVHLLFRSSIFHQSLFELSLNVSFVSFSFFYRCSCSITREPKSQWFCPSIPLLGLSGFQFHYGQKQKNTQPK